MIGIANGQDLVRLGALIAQHAEAADLEGLYHDVFAQVVVPLDGSGPEHVAFRVGVDLFTASLPGPRVPFLVQHLQVSRIGDIVDLQVAPNILVHVPSAVEIHDILPGVEGFHGNRIVGLDGHVTGILIGIPVVQLAFKGLGFVLVRRGRGIDEQAGFRIHAIALRIGFGRCPVFHERVCS